MIDNGHAVLFPDDMEKDEAIMFRKFLEDDMKRAMEVPSESIVSDVGNTTSVNLVNSRLKFLFHHFSPLSPNL